MQNRHTGKNLPEGYVRENFYLCYDKKVLIGVFSLKFELTEYPTGRYFKFQSTKGSTSKAATTVGEITVYGALNEE